MATCPCGNDNIKMLKYVGGGRSAFLICKHHKILGDGFMSDVMDIMTKRRKRGGNKMNVLKKYPKKGGCDKCMCNLDKAFENREIQPENLSLHGSGWLNDVADGLIWFGKNIVAPVTSAVIPGIVGKIVAFPAAHADTIAHALSPGYTYDDPLADDPAPRVNPERVRHFAPEPETKHVIHKRLNLRGGDAFNIMPHDDIEESMYYEKPMDQNSDKYYHIYGHPYMSGGGYVNNGKNVTVGSIKKNWKSMCDDGFPLNFEQYGLFCALNDDISEGLSKSGRAPSMTLAAKKKMMKLMKEVIAKHGFYLEGQLMVKIHNHDTNSEQRNKEIKSYVKSMAKKGGNMTDGCYDNGVYKSPKIPRPHPLEEYKGAGVDPYERPGIFADPNYNSTVPPYVRNSDSDYKSYNVGMVNEKRGGKKTKKGSKKGGNIFKKHKGKIALGIAGISTALSLYDKYKHPER